MKRILASTGIAALGAASLQAAYTPGLTPMEQSKPWSISLGVRGFFDDNYVTQRSSLERDSYGVSINPTAALNFALDQTLISASYSYDLRWYEDRERNEADHNQFLKLRLAHAFTDQLSAEISEQFTYAQDGSVTFGEGGSREVLQSDADNIRNNARASVSAGLSRNVKLDVAYRNIIVDYENEGFGSYSALLDRMEHRISLEAALKVASETSLFLGYEYGIVEHRSDDELNLGPYFGFDPRTGVLRQMGPTADVRDANSHYIYAGVGHQFSPKVDASIRAGAQITDYTNSDDLEAFYRTFYVNQSVDDNTVNPYVDARVSWTYNPGSYLSIGGLYTLNQTDVGSALDQSSAAIFANLNHRVNPRWTVGLNGLFQHSTFNGGVFDGENQLLYQAGVHTSYMFGPNLSAEAGYNFDKVDSDSVIDYRDYSRNQVYIGLRAIF